MNKTESNQMKQYEMLYIISNKYSDNELAPIMEKVQKTIESKEGKIVRDEVWGKKKLAYPIKGNIYGYYVLLEFDTDSEKLKEINNSLRIVSDVIRYQIVKRVPKAEPGKEKEIRKPAAETQVKKVEEAPSLSKEAKAKEAKKVDLKDLDEKLDKILDVDSLL